MTDEAELGFHARPFAIEHGIGATRRDGDVRILPIFKVEEVNSRSRSIAAFLSSGPSGRVHNRTGKGRFDFMVAVK
jgi:hypothetical protein